MLDTNFSIKKQILSDDHHMGLWVHWCDADDKTINDLTNMDIVSQSLVLHEAIAKSGDFKLGTINASSCEFDIIIDEHFPISKADLKGKKFELYIICHNYENGQPVYYNAGMNDVAFIDFNKNDVHFKANYDGEYDYYLKLIYGSSSINTSHRFATYEKGDNLRDHRFYVDKTNASGASLTRAQLNWEVDGHTYRTQMPITGLTDCAKIPLGVFVVDECDLSTDKHTRHLTAYDQLYSDVLDSEISYANGATVYMSDIIETISEWTGLDLDLSYIANTLPVNIVSDTNETETYTFNGMPIDGSCTITLVKSNMKISGYDGNYSHVYQWLADQSAYNARNLLLRLENAFGFNFVYAGMPLDAMSGGVSLVTEQAAWRTAYEASSLYRLVLGWKDKFRAAPQPNADGEFTMWRIASAVFSGMMYDQVEEEGRQYGLDISVHDTSAHFMDSAKIPLYATTGQHALDNVYEAAIYFPADGGYKVQAFDDLSSAGRVLPVSGIRVSTQGRIYTKRIDGAIPGSRYGVARYIKLSDLWEAIRVNMYWNLYNHGLIRLYNGDPDEAEWWSQDDYESYLQFENYAHLQYFTFSYDSSGFAQRYQSWFNTAHNNGGIGYRDVWIRIDEDWAMLIDTSDHNEGWAYDFLGGLEILAGFYIEHLDSFVYNSAKIIELSNDIDPQTGYEYWSPHQELRTVIERHYNEPFANLQFVASSNVSFKVRDLIAAYAELHGAVYRMNRYGDPEFMGIEGQPLYPGTDLYPDATLYPSSAERLFFYLPSSGGFPDDTLFPSLLIYPSTGDEEELPYIVKKSVQYRFENPLRWKGVRLNTSTGWLDPVILNELAEDDPSYKIYEIDNCIVRYFAMTNDIRDLIYENVWSAIGDMEIYSVDKELVGMPWIECGDYIVMDENDEERMILVFDRKLKGIQGLTDVLSQRLR